MIAQRLLESLSICGLGLGLFLILLVYGAAVYRLARLLIERGRALSGIAVFLAGFLAPSAMWLWATRLVVR